MKHKELLVTGAALLLAIGGWYAMMPKIDCPDSSVKISGYVFQVATIQHREEEHCPKDYVDCSEWLPDSSIMTRIRTMLWLNTEIVVYSGKGIEVKALKSQIAEGDYISFCAIKNPNANHGNNYLFLGPEYIRR